jgi:hypothetical protein
MKPGLLQPDLPTLGLSFFSHNMFSSTSLLPGTMPLPSRTMISMTADYRAFIGDKNDQIIALLSAIRMIS